MYETILVPTDGSTGSEAAADEAIDLAAELGATVVALFVVDTHTVQSDAGNPDLVNTLESEGERATDAVVERATDRGVQARGLVVEGTPYRSILNTTGDEDIDLVVMGTHGRTGLERYLLGSVTEKVVRTADVPVLTSRTEVDE